MLRRGYESVNISRAATLTNLFYLFFHGGKSALLPFLTLFFRLIGLTALEAGGIIAAKTITGLIWAPLWARCASAYNRQRVVLMFSLFMMIVTNLVFPALYTELARPDHCNKSLQDTSSSLAASEAPTVPLSENFTTLASTTPPKTSSPSTTPYPTSRMKPTATPTTTESAKSTQPPKELMDLYDEAVKVLGQFGLTPKDVLEANLTVHEMYETVKLMVPNITVTENIIGRLFAILKEKEGQKTENSSEGLNQADKDSDEEPEREKRSSDWVDVDTIKSKLISIQSTLQSDRTLLCLVILAIIIAGEIFSSPVEKVADDSWFDFLNRIDDLERYGQQRFWGSLAFVLVPIIVTITVDNTPCFLPFHLHHFLLHFYIFAVLMSVALVISCCYPIPPPATSKYVSKVSKAVRAICCDGRGFLFSVTLLLAGAVYASFHNFLFWRIQDLGGKESTMGLCVSAAAFAEIPMLLFSSRIVKRIGNCWAVSLALLVLAVRVASYSAIPYPWAIVPVEFCHGITHTSLWLAVLSYDDFNVGAAVDRSIRSILSSFYFGIGFSAGSVVSGYLYHVYGAQVLYWAASALTGGWMVLFSLIQKCLPRKEKVRYIKLLRSESDNSDEDDDDDWLEMALKEK